MKKLSTLGLVLLAINGAEKAQGQTCDGLFRSSQSHFTAAVGTRELAQIGQTFERRDAFNTALESALSDYKQFHRTYGPRIQSASAISSFTMGLKLHQDAVAVGRFVKRFEEAHPFVRVFMLEVITELVRSNSTDLSLRLKDRSSLEDPLLALNRLTKSEMEEKAFFESMSKGEALRPNLLVSPTVLEAGLRYLKKHNFDFTSGSVPFAASYLVDLSIRDSRIDEAILQVLRHSENTKARAQIEFFFRPELASLELLMVSRRLSGFTKLDSPLDRIQAELSETTTVNLLFLRHLIEFNWKYGLDRVGLLSDMTAAYFARNPEQLDQLSRLTPRATEFYRREQMGRHSRR